MSFSDFGEALKISQKKNFEVKSKSDRTELIRNFRDEMCTLTQNNSYKEVINRNNLNSIYNTKLLINDENHLIISEDENSDLTLGDAISNLNYIHLDKDIDYKTEKLPLELQVVFERAKISQILLKRYNKNAVRYDQAEEYQDSLEKNGIIAETMVKAILEKASLKNNRKFTIPKTTNIEDQDEKIDFKIHFEKDTFLGQLKDKNIQFTTNLSTKNIRYKRKQLKRVKNSYHKDVILVSIDFQRYVRAFRNWDNQNNKTGPYISSKDKKDILTQVFTQIFKSKDTGREFVDKLEL